MNQDSKEGSPAGLRVLFALALMFVFTGCASTGGLRSMRHKPLTLYFARHAETLANATGDKSEANQRSFTEKGQAQIDSLTRALSGIPVDHVLVSPTLRTRMTVLPFLRERGLTAEVWPELEEWRMESQVRAMAGPDAGEGIIDIEPENREWFRFRDEDSRRRYFARNYTGGIRQLEIAVEMIKKRFGGSGETVLIVGHSNAGSRLIEMLEGKELEVRYRLKLARLNRLEEGRSGKFRLVMLNGEEL